MAVIVQRSCGNGVLYGPVKPEGSGRIGFSRLRCKRYSCPSCGPRKLRQVRKRIGQVATERRLTRFVTLTLDPRKLEGAQRASAAEMMAISIPYLRNVWAKMRVKLSRKYGKSIAFIAVLQPQESGVAHLHVLVGRFIPKEWLSEAWQSVGGGEIVDVRYVDVHRVSAYLSGYLSRVTKLPGNTKRFTVSRGLAIWEKHKTTGGWKRWDYPIERALEYEALGHRIVDATYQVEEGTRTLVFFVVAADP